jgi:hypothetical protein
MRSLGSRCASERTGMSSGRSAKSARGRFESGIYRVLELVVAVYVRRYARTTALQRESRSREAVRRKSGGS